MADLEDPVTQLVGRWAAGDAQAFDRLVPLVYDELRRLARGYLRGERKDHTLQPTALVHEAFLRISGDAPTGVECRGQLLALLARTMRRVLVDHARRRHSDKRGGGKTLVTLADAPDGAAARQTDVLILDETLARLAKLDRRQAEVVELRVFGGLDIDEVAATLGISSATVKREWAVAKAWLHREMRG